MDMYPQSLTELDAMLKSKGITALVHSWSFNSLSGFDTSMEMDVETRLMFDRDHQHTENEDNPISAFERAMELLK